MVAEIAVRYVNSEVLRGGFEGDWAREFTRERRNNAGITNHHP